MEVAAVELGGSKVLVSVGVDARDHAHPVRIDTMGADATLAAVVAALRAFEDEGRRFAAIGVASFGPIDLDPGSPGYGCILNTPKPGWIGVDVLAPLRAAFDAPLVLETDVNAAAIAEGAYAARGCKDYAYVTVGTGVGVGLVVAGRPVHGAGHPEAGHLLARRRADDAFPGVCFAHGDCVEGLIGGPALEARFASPAQTFGPAHPAWDLAGDYLAQLCMALVLTSASQRIVLGGGVGARPELLAATRRHLFRQLAGYLDRYQNQAQVDALIVPAALANSGLAGALALARRLAQAS